MEMLHEGLLMQPNTSYIDIIEHITPGACFWDGKIC